MAIHEGNILAWVPDPLPDLDEEIIYSLERVLYVEEKMVVCFVLPTDKKGFSQLRSRVKLRTEEEIELALAENRVVISTEEPKIVRQFLCLSEEYRAKHQAVKDKAWSVLEGLVGCEPSIYIPREGGEIVRKWAEKKHVSVVAVNKWLAYYWAAGKNQNALYPDYFDSGAPGQDRESKTSQKDRDKLIAGGKKFRRKGVSWRKVRLYTAQTKFAIGTDSYGKPIIGPTPSVGVLYYHFNKAKRKDLRRSLIREFGWKQFQHRFKPRIYTTHKGVFGPGAVYQIDATVLDVYLVSEYQPDLVIGRPVLYIVIDCFSHMIVGFYIGLAGPCWLSGASLALAQAFSPKEPFLEKYGIHELLEESFGLKSTTGLWPAQHIPRQLVTDSEQNTRFGEIPVNSLDLIMTTTEAYMPYLKGLVEQRFNMIDNEVIEWAPGAVLEYRQEMEIRPQKCPYDAEFTLRDMYKILACWVLRHNHNLFLTDYPLTSAMTQDKVRPIPIELWDYGCAMFSGCLRQRPAEAIRIGLLPRGEAKVSQEGLLFNHMSYVSDHAVQSHEFIQAAYRGRFPVDVYYHPHEKDEIYVELPNEKRTAKYTLNSPTEDRYKDYFLEDVQVDYAMKQLALNEHERTRLQADSDWDYVFGLIRKVAKKRHKLVLRSSGSLKKDIKDFKGNRELEIGLMRLEDKLDKLRGAFGSNGGPSPSLSADELEKTKSEMEELLLNLLQEDD